MKWFNNLKIGSRLLIGFGMIMAIALVIGLIGINGISKVDKLDTELYENMTVPLGQLVTITSSYNNIKADLRDVTLSRDGVNITKYSDNVRADSDNFDKELL